MKWIRILVWLLIALSSVSVYADNVQGFIVTLDGQKVGGSFYLQAEHLLYERVNFKANHESEFKVFLPGEIRAFQIGNAEYFESFDLKGVKVFLKFLLRARLSLLNRKMLGTTQHFLFETSQELTPLPHLKRSFTYNNKRYNVEDTAYKSVLRRYSTGCGSIGRLISSTSKFEENRIKKIVEEINYCRGDSISTVSIYADNVQGFIVTLDGHKVEGFFYSQTENVLYERVSFKANSDNEFKEFLPGEIRAFQIGNDEYFESFDLDGTKVFLRFLLRARVSFLNRKMPGTTQHFLYETSQELAPLPHLKRSITYKNKRYNVEDTAYKTVLRRYSTGCKDIGRLISRTNSFDESRINMIVREINACKGDSILANPVISRARTARGVTALSFSYGRVINDSPFGIFGVSLERAPANRLRFFSISFQSGRVDGIAEPFSVSSTEKFVDLFVRYNQVLFDWRTFKPYLGAGLGYTSGKYTISDPSIMLNESYEPFTWSFLLAGGAMVNLSDQAFLRLEGQIRLTTLSETKFLASYSIGGINDVGLWSVNTTQNYFSLNLVFGFRFIDRVD
ncbi:MAG: hypothetical protein JNL17_06360 [Cyclobacteriaceae bacterium]|nr:hypothetical protein [Cyclobacteriaceae bacterium]